MGLNTFLQHFSQNTVAFAALLSGASEEEYRWRPAAEKWCLLEILCHLTDEENEDFRTRTQHILRTPELPMASIDPVGWVTKRHYAEANYEERLAAFLEARKNSTQWLQSLPPLSEPVWDKVHHHPTLGLMSAKMMLANWLAHDYLHIRQIVRLKYERLKSQSQEELSYAGDW